MQPLRRNVPSDDSQWVAEAIKRAICSEKKSKSVVRFLEDDAYRAKSWRFLRRARRKVPVPSALQGDPVHHGIGWTFLLEITGDHLDLIDSHLAKFLGM